MSQPSAFGRMEPFIWDQNELWGALEREFVAAKGRGGEALTASIDRSLTFVSERLDELRASRPPTDPAFREIETAFFEIAPKIAACPDRVGEYVDLYNRVRSWVKDQSVHWDFDRLEVRQTLYRLIYGGRMGLEEVILQSPTDALASTVLVRDEPSSTPSTVLYGVRLHSGDLLLSRGGTSASAFIARAHDYPGNFSHVAVVHVDEARGKASIIEADIKGGVRTRTPDEYVAEDKLRIMVLRPRSDLGEIRRDPLLPHRAAAWALRLSRSRRIPYDLAMDREDHSRMFCSQVAYAAYKPLGLRLWTGMSYISRPGVGRWLAAVGVENFETQEPSDLEYDPQLRVVAEWRDQNRLLHDHMDNAIIEVRLDEADRGEPLTLALWKLPFMKLIKGYSVILNGLGREGPVPEAMTARTALLYMRFGEVHEAVKRLVVQDVEDFREKNRYLPPYWQLLDIIRRLRVDKP